MFPNYFMCCKKKEKKIMRETDLKIFKMSVIVRKQTFFSCKEICSM